MISFNFSLRAGDHRLYSSEGEASEAHGLIARDHNISFWQHDPKARPLFDDFSTSHPRELLQALSRFFHFMPHHSAILGQALKPPHDLFGLKESDHWIFFGGTFNPWHLGHRACLERACAFDPAANIILVPDHSPWKETQRSTPWTSFLQLREQTQGLVNAVYPGFLAQERGNPTIDWLPFVGGRKSLLIGADHLRDFRRWKNYGQLLSHLDALLVCPRYIEEEQSLSQLRSSLQKESETPIILLDGHEYEHLSSSFLRKKSPE